MSTVLDDILGAERLSRRIQVDATAGDAAAMVRAWPELTHAAQRVGSRLPAAPLTDRAVERICVAGAALSLDPIGICGPAQDPGIQRCDRSRQLLA